MVSIQTRRDRKIKRRFVLFHVQFSYFPFSRIRCLDSSACYMVMMVQELVDEDDAKLKESEKRVGRRSEKRS